MVTCGPKQRPTAGRGVPARPQWRPVAVWVWRRGGPLLLPWPGLCRV